MPVAGCRLPEGLVAKAGADVCTDKMSAQANLLFTEKNMGAKGMEIPRSAREDKTILLKWSKSLARNARQAFAF